MAAKLKVGVIGCGAILPAYLSGSRPYANLEVIACADLDLEKAKSRAKEFRLRASSVDDLLNAPDVDIVLNLTIPSAHATINLKALQAGKHAYCEKPFALSLAEGQTVIDEAKRRKLYAGCAPDTFLGTGIQTARRVIDEGAIGEPVGATAFVLTHGPEPWHPSPAFFYKAGGGPMLDMGPYYVTALVNLIGPVKRVTGSARRTFAQRTITSQPLAGTIIDVEVPTHYAGVMDFANGAVGTIITSFDVWAHTLPFIEVHGTEGSLQVPNPNNFDGKVMLRRAGDKDWTEIKHHHRGDVGRGIGLADMAQAIITGRPHRASDALAFHVLEVMLAFAESSTSNRHIELKTSCARPAPLPTGLALGELD